MQADRLSLSAPRRIRSADRFCRRPFIAASPGRFTAAGPLRRKTGISGRQQQPTAPVPREPSRPFVSEDSGPRRCGQTALNRFQTTHHTPRGVFRKMTPQSRPTGVHAEQVVQGRMFLRVIDHGGPWDQSGFRLIGMHHLNRRCTPAAHLVVRPVRLRKQAAHSAENFRSGGRGFGRTDRR